MCWRFLRDFWGDFVFGCRDSSEDTERAADTRLDGPGTEKVKGIGVEGGKEV